MADSHEQKPKANWRGPVALLLVFAVLGLFLAAAAGRRKPDRFIVTLKDVVTNSAGMPEVLVEIENKAGDVTLEPVLQVATHEIHGITNRAAFRDLQTRKRPPWVSMRYDDDIVTYHIVERFADSNAQVQSTTGTNLFEGQVTTLRVEGPTNKSFRVFVNCWRSSVPNKSALRLRMEILNTWANARLGIPIVFESGNWMHVQLFSPLIPKGALTNKASIHSIGVAIEHPL